MRFVFRHFRSPAAKIALVVSLAVCQSSNTQIQSYSRSTRPTVVTGESQSKKKVNSAPYGPPTVVARLKNSSVSESSGLVASRNNREAYWTHNDSGDGPFIYAFDNKGESLGVWRVSGAEADDWEDIAIGPGPEPGKSYLYIADTGDNSGNRRQIVVYRVLEPTFTVADRESTKAKPRVTERVDAIRFRYPDGRHDAEALLIHPTSGKLYLLTKVPIANSIVYESSPPFDVAKVSTLKRTGDVRVPSIFGGVITGGDISPDGRRIALCDYFQGYELVLPTTSTSFDDIWKQRAVGFDLGARNQGEAIAYRLDGRAILATSEGRRAALIQVLRK
jgi:hypothetical protein